MLKISKIKHVKGNETIAEIPVNQVTKKDVEQFKKDYKKKNKLASEILIDIEYKHYPKKN